MHDSSRTEWRAPITILAIFAPLVVLVIVAVTTWRAEQRYAIVTRQVVHDYAAIAAWQYARRADGALHEEVMHAFRGIASGHQRTSKTGVLLSPEAILAARSDTAPVLLSHARFAFAYDYRTGLMQLAGDSVDDATRTTVVRRLRGLAASVTRETEPHRVLFDRSTDGDIAIALWMISAPDAPIIAAYGVVAPAPVLIPRLTAIIGESSLLPATTVGARLTAADVAIRLIREDGGVAFATSRAPGSTAATDTAGLRLSGLRTIVDIPPHTVDALLVGGAPKSQLPALALMIVLATVLAIFGLQHERRARELEHLRTRFVANVSHELRTPLAQISMFAETLSLGRERSDAERRNFASIIFAEARRLTTLVESVLRFSRGDAAGERLRVESVRLQEEINGALAAFAPIADAAGASIDADVPSDAHALIDRAAFRQVMLNLLDNAVKHGGDATRVAISTSRTGNEARIVVDDSGPGVPAEWREQIFEPFVRMEHTHVAGAGIGLAVVRDLVVAHGGRVWVEPSPLGGARFIVTVPASGAIAAEPVSSPPVAV